MSESCLQEQILGISGQSRKDLVHHNNTCSSSDSYIFFHMERKFWRQVTGLGSLMEVGGASSDTLGAPQGPEGHFLLP